MPAGNAKVGPSTESNATQNGFGEKAARRRSVSPSPKSMGAGPMPILTAIGMLANAQTGDANENTPAMRVRERSVTRSSCDYRQAAYTGGPTSSALFAFARGRNF